MRPPERAPASGATPHHADARPVRRDDVPHDAAIGACHLPAWRDRHPAGVAARAGRVPTVLVAAGAARAGADSTTEPRAATAPATAPPATTIPVPAATRTAPAADGYRADSDPTAQPRTELSPPSSGRPRTAEQAADGVERVGHGVDAAAAQTQRASQFAQSGRTGAQGALEIQTLSIGLKQHFATLAGMFQRI